MDQQSSSNHPNAIGDAAATMLIELAREENRLTANLVDLAKERTENDREQTLLGRELNEMAERRTAAADLRTQLSEERTQHMREQIRLGRELNELAERRTVAADRRTELSEDRTRLAKHQTGFSR